MTWKRMPEDWSGLKRGMYLVTNGRTARVAWHLMRGQDIVANREWTHYMPIPSLPKVQA